MGVEGGCANDGHRQEIAQGQAWHRSRGGDGSVDLFQEREGEYRGSVYCILNQAAHIGAAGADAAAAEVAAEEGDAAAGAEKAEDVAAAGLLDSGCRRARAEPASRTADPEGQSRNCRCVTAEVAV